MDSIRLDKHVPDESKKKAVSFWTVLVVAVVIIIIVIRLPHIKNDIIIGRRNTAYSTANSAKDAILIEGGAYLEDYTMFVVDRPDGYYVYWYMNKTKALMAYDNAKDFAVPFETKKYAGGYPFQDNPFLQTKKLDPDGNWKTAVSLETTLGFELYGAYDSTMKGKAVEYSLFDIPDEWTARIPENVDIYVIRVDGKSLTPDTDTE